MDRRVRVLWLIKGLGPGGAERLLVSAARVGRHDQVSYEVAYVVAAKSLLVPELAAHGVVSHCLSQPGTGTPWPVTLRRLLLGRKYDVVHTHSPLVAGVARIVVRTLPRSRRPRVMSTEHNMWDSYALPTRLLNAVLYATDARRWAVSERVRTSVWGRLRPGVEVLVHGIVVEDAAVVTNEAVAGLRADLGADSDDVLAITVANFRTEKAYPDLMRAAATALRDEPRLRLVIVGQGQLESEVRRLHAELGLGDRCRILGYRADVSALLGACDFFVLASRFEGFPIALMEAMAAGLPVAATNVGGIPDAVTDGREGFLTNPGDVPALARSMKELVRSDHQRASMGTAALARGRQFDVRTAVRTMEAAYLGGVDAESHVNDRGDSGPPRTS